VNVLIADIEGEGDGGGEEGGGAGTR
jgi:hypothetical protein